VALSKRHKVHQMLSSVQLPIDYGVHFLLPFVKCARHVQHQNKARYSSRVFVWTLSCAYVRA
jgi:hypothetical protein